MANIGDKVSIFVYVDSARSGIAWQVFNCIDKKEHINNKFKKSTIFKWEAVCVVPGCDELLHQWTQISFPNDSTRLSRRCSLHKSPGNPVLSLEEETIRAGGINLADFKKRKKQAEKNEARMPSFLSSERCLDFIGFYMSQHGSVTIPEMVKYLIFLRDQDAYKETVSTVFPESIPEHVFERRLRGMILDAANRGDFVRLGRGKGTKYILPPPA